MKLKIKAGLILSILALVAVLALSCSGSKAANSNSYQPATIEQASSIFKVDGLTINPSEVNAGVDALITAKVTNTGVSTEKYSGQVRLDNLSEPSLPTYLACQRVDIPAGDTQVVGVVTNISNPGKYKVTWAGVTQDFQVNALDPSAGSQDLAATQILAPDFTAVDVVTGKTISLKQYSNTPILLNFVNYGCNPQVNDVVSAQLIAIKKLKEQRSDFVPVSVFCGCCSPDVLRQFAKQNNFNWPWVLDTDYSIAAKYSNYLKKYGYPTLVFLNSDHYITETTGYVDQSALNDKLNSLVVKATQ